MSIDTSKIIHGVVGGGRYTVTSPIVKEDYGLYLKIEGLELPSTYEVDFSNSEHSGTSVTMIGNSDGVLIPSQFIASGKDIFAFLYHVGVDYGQTVYKFRIPNKLRPDRMGETPTPEQQSVIDQAISALNSAVAQTAQDVIDAEASAQSAQGYAEQAETARDTAQTYANNAQTSANNASASASQASASATASANSASQSAQIKDDVEDMVDDAQTSASASAQSATASANSASQASGYAQSASASASSAQGYASQAQTSAQTASTKASEASTSASTASAKATESAQSATSAQGYAQTAESAKTASQTAQGLAESARDLAQGYAEDAQGYANDAQASAESVSASASQIAQNTSDIASLEEDIYKPYAVDSASGAIASFVDGADDIPLKSLIVNIDPVQDLHGYDSPWVGGGGKNLFDVENAVFTASSSATLSSYGSYADNGKVYNGGKSGTSTGSGITIPVAEGESYTVSALVGGENVTLYLYAVTYDANTNIWTTSQYLSYASFSIGTRTSKTVTIPTGFSHLVAIWYGATQYASYEEEIQIESGSSATSYAPYENICPISGWTGCNLWKNGGNILHNTDYGAVYNTAADTDLTTIGNAQPVTQNGNETQLVAGAAWRGRIFATEPLKAGSYTLKAVCTSDKLRLTVYATDKNLVVKRNLRNIAGTANLVQTYTVSEGERIAVSIGFNTTGTYTITDFKLDVGSIATAYEPYKGTPIPISWQSEAGTVYGGRLDVLSGVLRVNRKIRTVDAISNVASAYIHSDGVDGYVLDSDIQPRLSPMLQSTQYCNKLKFQAKAIWTSGVSSEPNVFAINQSQIHIKIANDLLGITDYTQETTATAKEKLNAWLAENPVTLTIPIEPIEVQLDARTVNSLYGQNNIFADTGDVSCEYRADTRLYIEKLTQPEEDDMVADSAITSGQFFMIGNSLYKALANIASGATITVGTNAQRVSLADALNLINT